MPKQTKRKVDQLDESNKMNSNKIHKIKLGSMLSNDDPCPTHCKSSYFTFDQCWMATRLISRTIKNKGNSICQLNDCGALLPIIFIKNITYGSVQTSRELSLQFWLWEEEYPFPGVSKHGITSS